MREIFEYYKNANLNKFNTFHLNSNADEIYVSHSVKQIYSVCKKLNTLGIDYKVIGLGANLVFSDSGFTGAIIVNRSQGLTFDADSVICDSGVNLTNLIQKCYLRSLGGFERLAGIPATIGGAIVNNVGAFNTSISDHIEWVQCFMKNNPSKKFKFTREECKFDYRDSIFKSGEFVITEAKINLQSLSPSLIKSNMIEALTKKKSTQPLDLPSAGSVFKRLTIPIQNFKNAQKLASRFEGINLSENGTDLIVIPAKLIDELHLKGLTVGGAQISNKHAGFIINKGNATSSDIKKLVTLIKEKVKTETNIDLIEEIEFVD